MAGRDEGVSRTPYGADLLRVLRYGASEMGLTRTFYYYCILHSVGSNIFTTGNSQQASLPKICPLKTSGAADGSSLFEYILCCVYHDVVVFSQAKVLGYNV